MTLVSGLIVSLLVLQPRCFACLFVCVLFFWGLSASGAPEGRSDEAVSRLAWSKHWLRLLHYRGNILGQLRSRVNSPSFFLASDGAKDPLAELKANILAFREPAVPSERANAHAQCQFPERYRFVKEMLGAIPEVPQFQDQPCPDFEEWRQRMESDSATLVFSSSYPHAVSSLFGHTFLRLNLKANREGKRELLDYGINFEALVPQNENAIAYAWKGTTGGYPGWYSLQPYYVKLNEYLFGESRDIWEYELDLNSQQMERLIGHIWELIHGVTMPYYYFDENCSLQLMALLEVARDDWVLSDFNGYVLPVDTLKRAHARGATRSVSYRPSLRKVMWSQVRLLSGEEERLFYKIVDNPDSFQTGKSVAFYDAINSFLHYEKQQNSGVLSEGRTRLMRASLLERSQLGSVPRGQSSLPSDEKPPHLSHAPFRLGLAGGSRAGSAFADVHFRLGLHDLLEDHSGYIRHSQFVGGEFHLRYWPRSGHVSLDRVNLFEGVSLFPMSLLERTVSWKLQAALVRAPEYREATSDQDPLVGRGAGGAGAALRILSDRAIGYAMGMLVVDLGASNSWLKFNPRLETGVLLNPISPYKTLLVVAPQANLVELSWKQSFQLSLSWAVQSQVQFIHCYGGSGVRESDISIGLNHLF